MSEIVLVTGATGLIGAPTVARFAANRWQVVATAHRRTPKDVPTGVRIRPTDVSTSPKTDAGCWLWTGCTTAGCGRSPSAHQSGPAQRFAWELVIEPSPRGMELGHRNACPHHCVNPD